MPLQEQVQAALAVKTVNSKDQGCPSNRSKRFTGFAGLFMGSLRPYVKAWRQLCHSRNKYRQLWPSKLSIQRIRAALPTAQNVLQASQGFSWAACDRRSKLGDSCDTPRQVLAALTNASAFGQRLFFLAFFAAAPVSFSCFFLFFPSSSLSLSKRASNTPCQLVSCALLGFDRTDTLTKL